jgi:hypothetical protein
MDLAVIKRDPTTGAVSFGISTQPISGTAKLVQVVVLSLLNVPGKDLLDPALGGGVPDLIGMNIDLEDPSEATAELVRKVKKVQSEVLASQVGLAILDEEKLQQLTVVSVGPTESGDGLAIVLRIINAAGRVTDVVL